MTLLFKIMKKAHLTHQDNIFMNINHETRYKWILNSLLFIFIIVNAQLIAAGYWKLSLFVFLFLAFIILSHTYPSYIFLLWILLYPLSHNFFSISLGKFPDITFTRVVIIALFILELLKYVLWNERLIHKPQKKIVFLWITYALLVTINSFRPDLVDQKHSLQIAIDAVIIPTIVFILGMKYFSDSKTSKLFFKIIPIVGIYCALLAIIEYYFKVDIFPTKYGILGTQYYVRANGPFFSNETLSCFLIYIIAFVFVSIIQSERLVLKVIYSVSIVIIQIGILTGLMRASILISLFTIISLFWIFGSKKMRIILIIVTFFFLGVTGIFLDKIAGSAIYQTRLSNINNIEIRLSTYKTGIELVKDNFLFGVGYRNYPHVSLNYESRFFMMRAAPDPHNGFLLVIGQLGIIGLIVFILIYYNIFKYLFMNKHKCYRKLYIILLISFLLMNISNAFVDNIHMNIIHMIFISFIFAKDDVNKKIFLKESINNCNEPLLNAFIGRPIQKD